MKRHRNNNLDLLRLLFASMVVVAHCYELTAGRSAEPLVALFGTLTLGNLAVDCFFILSGFLITESWLRAPHAGPFLFKRIRRIYPAYVVAFLVSVFIVGPLATTQPLPYLQNLDARQLATNLITLHAPVTPPISGVANPVVNASMWTLLYEFCCYLALMIAGVAGYLKSKPLLVATLLVTLLSSIFIPHADGGGNHLFVVTRFTLMFLSGTCFYILDIRRFLSAKLAVPAVAALAFCLTSHRLAEAGVALFGAYVIFYVSFARTLWNPLPDISYGTYLYGWPAEILVIKYLDQGPLLDCLISIPVALACGWLSWVLVEAQAQKISYSDLRAGMGRGRIMTGKAVAVLLSKLAPRAPR